MCRNELNSYLGKLTRATMFALLCATGCLFVSTDLNVVIATTGFVLVAVELAFSINQHKKHRNYLSEIVLLGALLLWFWIEAISMSWVEDRFAIQGLYSSFQGRSFPEYAVASAFFQISIFQVALLFSLFIFKTISLPNFSLRSRVIPYWSVGYLFVFLALLGWFTLFLNSKSVFQSVLLFRQSDIEIQAGFTAYFSIISIAIAGLAFAMIVCTNYRKSILIWSAFLIGASLAFFSGTRFKILYVFFPALLCVFHIYQSRQMNFKFIAIFLVLFISLILLASIQFIFRYGGEEEVSYFSAFLGSGHLTALINAIGIADRFNEPIMQSMGPLFVTDFIPRFIWPEKPLHQYWEIYNLNLAPQFGNVTPSILGQYYMNWWWIGGVLSGCVLGFFSGLASKLILSHNKTNTFSSLFLACYILTFVFLSFRVLSANYITYLLVLVLLAPFTIRNIKVESR